MSKYDFIKQGNLLYWHTADNDVECRIISTPEKVDSDSIILIATGSSEIEVLASELSPIGSSRSHKEEFLRWKKEREAEGMEFFNRLSEVMETDNDLAVGDMVAFTNDYGVVFGPKEVLAFRKPWNGGRCVYIDSDAYWFPDRPGQLTILSKVQNDKRRQNLKTALRQYCRRSFQLAEILHTATLLRLGDLCYPSALLLRTDRLHRSFPLYQYTGSGIRLGNGQTDH